MTIAVVFLFISLVITGTGMAVSFGLMSSQAFVQTSVLWFFVWLSLWWLILRVFSKRPVNWLRAKVRMPKSLDRFYAESIIFANSLLVGADREILENSRFYRHAVSAYSLTEVGTYHSGKLKIIANPVALNKHLITKGNHTDIALRIANIGYLIRNGHSAEASPILDEIVADVELYTTRYRLAKLTHDVLQSIRINIGVIKQLSVLIFIAVIIIYSIVTGRPPPVLPNILP